MSLAARSLEFEGEHPDVVLRDVASRPQPRGHVIVFANEKGGVGKSTIAFQTAIALADLGHKVAAVDLDRRQQTLARALDNRLATSRRLKVKLPLVRHVVLERQSAACLTQEIARIGRDCDYVLIDAAGNDTPITRRAIAMAQTLVTPVNNSFVDLDLLGRFDALSTRPRELGHFAAVVNGLREARERCGWPPIDWVVLQNRTRRNRSANEARFDEALRELAPFAGFRLIEGLRERVAYRELFLLGLSHLDLRRIPEVAKMRADPRREIEHLIADLGLMMGIADGPDMFAQFEERASESA